MNHIDDDSSVFMQKVAVYTSATVCYKVAEVHTSLSSAQRKQDQQQIMTKSLLFFFTNLTDIPFIEQKWVFRGELLAFSPPLSVCVLKLSSQPGTWKTTATTPISCTSGLCSVPQFSHKKAHTGCQGAGSFSAICNQPSNIPVNGDPQKHNPWLCCLLSCKE